MNYINLTPHSLTIFRWRGDPNPVIVPPSGNVARVATRSLHQDTTEEGIPLFQVGYDDLEGMPADWKWPKEETILITSAMAHMALDIWLEENRPPNEESEPMALVWTAYPGELVRDDNGQPIGCIGLNL